MKKLISVLLAALMCFGVFSGALAEGVTGNRDADAADNVETSMIETDLPSGIYDDGRTLIVHPEDGDMFFDYDPDADCSDANTAMRNIDTPMILPSDFDDILIPDGNGFLAEIEPPVDGAIPVSNAKQLYDIRNNPQGNYYLTCDIDVSELENWGLTWTSIPSYSGIFDGQGHTIGLLLNPLFDQAQGTIENLSLRVRIVSENYTGNYLGSIVCKSSSINLINCVSTGVIEVVFKNSLNVGGMIGDSASSSFKNCINNTSISISSSQNIDVNVGGIVGANYRDSSFFMCVNNSNIESVSGNSICVGGLIGKNNFNWPHVHASSFDSCMNRGIIKANSYNSGNVFAGGLIGYNQSNNAGYSTSTFVRCINYSYIEAIANSGNAYSGGLQGGNTSKVTAENCCASGNVKAFSSNADAYAGGIEGSASLIVSIENCFCSSDVFARSELANVYSGGMVGYCGSSFSANKTRIVSETVCSETGAEESYIYVGGVVGYVSGSASIGYCLTIAVGGSACDSWHEFKGSIAGYVVNTLTLSDTCAYSSANSFSGYYGSAEGKENAVSYSGIIIVSNANYTIKVIDSFEERPLAGVTIVCDGYKATTDENGMARFSLPINTVIQITASKNKYATSIDYGVQLYSNSIKMIEMDYIGNVNNNPGSGSDPDSGETVTVGNYSFELPAVELGTDTIDGPTINIPVLNYSKPAFKLDIGLNLPYCKLAAKFDEEKKEIRILFNCGLDANHYNASENTYNAEFENKYKSVVDSFDLLMAGIDPVGWMEDIIQSDASVVCNCKVKFGGYAKISYTSGKPKLVGGAIAIGAETEVNMPIYPCLFRIKLGISADGEYGLFLDDNGVFQYTGTTNPGLSITGEIGPDFKIAKLVGGLKARGEATIKSPFDSLETSVSAKATIEGYVALGVFNGEIKKSWKLKEWTLYPRNKNDLGLTETLRFSETDYSPIPRGYLDSMITLRAIGDESLVMNSVYPYGEPQLVQLDDGRLVLVWVHDDGTRTDENRTALYYSICENGVWSTPAIVWDDGTADFSPVIAADGDNVHIVWQNMREVLEEGTTLDSSLTKTQICYTKLSSDGTIAQPTIVDAAGYYQANICMAAENGNVVVAWKENNSNNIWNEAGTYNVYRRYMTSGSWSSTSTVKSGATLITEVACGYIDGTPNVAYVMDVDGNAATVTDHEVYKYVGTSTTRVTNNSVDDCTIQYVNNDLYWRQDNELRSSGGTLGLSSEDDITLAAAYDGSLVAVIKTVVDGFNTELYGSFQNASGEWSVPAPITNYYGAIRSFSPIVCEDGSIAIALDNAELQEIEEDGDDVLGTTSMHVIVGSSLTDLIVTSGMSYDVDAVTPGEDLPMTVTVYNNSINAVNGVKAEFYDANNELVCTLNSDDVIECGEEKEITFSYPVPAELTLTEYTVKILPANVDDDIPDNNETSVTIGYADIAIENGRFNRTETAATVEADITNSGFTAAENVVASLRYQSAGGDFLGSIDLGTLAVGATEHVSFDIPATYLENSDELDLNTFYLYIETDTEEAHAYNNSETIVDEPIRVADIALDIHQKEMLVHETLQLTATIMPLDAANQLVRWASTNVDVATVDENGLVTCVGEGTATIYAISADGIFSEGCVINAEFPYYTVTFLDDDGTVLKTEQVKETDDATPPEVAERVGWSFVGWDGDFTNISGDVTLTAQYQINTYHVIYYINGEVYHTDDYEYGAEIIPLDEPDVEGYTFMGWDYIPEFMPAEDVIVTAETEINSYRLNYYVDGQFYQRVIYEFGAAVTPLAEPTKEDYVFSGWSEIPAVMPAHNVSVYGTFSIMTFAVTFVDWNGAVIDVQQVEIHNDAIAPDDPIRTGYTFTGWDRDFTNVTASMTVREYHTLYKCI